MFVQRKKNWNKTLKINQKNKDKFFSSKLIIGNQVSFYKTSEIPLFLGNLLIDSIFNRKLRLFNYNSICNMCNA
jgi:hypothetical protein